MYIYVIISSLMFIYGRCKHSSKRDMEGWRSCTDIYNNYLADQFMYNSWPLTQKQTRVFTGNLEYSHIDGHSLTRHTKHVFLDESTVKLNGTSRSLRIIGAFLRKSCQDGSHVFLALFWCVGLHSRLSSRSVVRRLGLECGKDGGDIVVALLGVGLNSILGRGGVLQYQSQSRLPFVEQRQSSTPTSGLSVWRAARMLATSSSRRPRPFAASASCIVQR